MVRISSCLVGVALVFAASAAKADTAADARRLGNIFCLLGKHGGENGRMYLVTRSLGEAINNAIRKNDEIAAAVPTEKPPLGDGVPFQSFPDNSPACRPGKLTDKGRYQELEIAYVFPDAPEGNWTDRLALVTEDGLLRIDDVFFGPGDATEGLRTTLAPLLQN
jgi:hypothetical protein